MKTIVWSGDIDDGLVSLVYKGGWSKLVLCSEGGDIYAARAICDYLGRVERHVVVTGKCFSSATAVAVAATSCVATPGCRFLLHTPSALGVEGGSKVLKNETHELDVWLTWYKDLLCERTKLSREDWTDLLEAETYMSATAALDAGLVDGILQ